jgi:uncharacterized protein YcfJ
MNKSMVVGTVLGASLAIAAGGIAGYQMLGGDEFAEVVGVTPLVERVETPREECHDQAVTRQKPIKDQHRVTGTVIGAVAGGIIGNELGGGGDNTGAKLAGAAVGGFAGNKVQQNMQQNATYTTTERVCNTVVDVSERTVGYDVTYRLGDDSGTVRMDHDPGTRIPVRDGQLVLTEAQTVPVQPDATQGS